MKKITISPPVAAVLLAVVLFVFSGFLPNSFGTDMSAAAGQAVRRGDTVRFLPFSELL